MEPDGEQAVPGGAFRRGYTVGDLWKFLVKAPAGCRRIVFIDFKQILGEEELEYDTAMPFILEYLRHGSSSDPSN